MNRRGIVTRGAAAAVAIPLSAAGGARAAVAPIRTYEVGRINIYHGMTSAGTEVSRNVCLDEVGGEGNPGSSLYVYVEEADIENFSLGRKAHLVWAEEN